MGYSGADWLKGSVKEISPFGERVADLLGEWACGIYHLEAALNNVDWDSDYYILINYSGSLDTFDNGNLTRLVLLAHWMCIRVEITSCNFRYLKIMFTPRIRQGNLYDRHPTIDQAVEKFKGFMCADGIEEVI